MRILHADARVTAWLSADGQPLPEPRTTEFLALALEHWAAHGFGIWIATTRDAGEFVGYAGMRHTDGRPVPGVKLLYAIRPERWGLGWATAIAREAIAREAPRLGLERIVAFTRTDDRASRRVMEKCGFVFEREIAHAGLPHVLYALRCGGRHPTAPG